MPTFFVLAATEICNADVVVVVVVIVVVVGCGDSLIEMNSNCRALIDAFVLQPAIVDVDWFEV
jgi:hypothetical protein